MTARCILKSLQQNQFCCVCGCWCARGHSWTEYVCLGERWWGWPDCFPWKASWLVFKERRGQLLQVLVRSSLALLPASALLICRCPCRAELLIRELPLKNPLLTPPLTLLHNLFRSHLTQMGAPPYPNSPQSHPKATPSPYTPTTPTSTPHPPDYRPVLHSSQRRRET